MTIAAKPEWHDDWSMLLTALARPELFFFDQPDGYPLPRTAEGVPYWSINIWLCGLPPWRDWQARKEMALIIPVIDRAITAAKALPA